MSGSRENPLPTIGSGMEALAAVQTFSTFRTQPILEPLLRESVNEHFKKICMTDLVPKFWSGLTNEDDAEVCLEKLMSALGELKKNVEGLSSVNSMLSLMPGSGSSDSLMTSVLQILKQGLYISQPNHIYDIIVKILKVAIDLWFDEQEDVKMDTTNENAEEDRCDDASGSDESSSKENSFLRKFREFITQLNALKLLQYFLDHCIVDVVQMKVKDYICQECAREFDSVMLMDINKSLNETISGWLAMLYGNSPCVRQEWFHRVECFGYEEFADLRISELFDILVEYPDSEPALHDLKLCLAKVNRRSNLISSLKSVFEKRLLQPGANTSDIITQYISSIKGLRLLDPSGVVLEQVCFPVRKYLKTRDDTVRCIVASLTDDCSNELADELATGEPVLVDLNEESDNEDQDFDSWEPDPVDADPSKTSKSRQTSDIISLLVNIYGSREMFVSEFRNLLADRLLQSQVYDISREVRNLELLKLRFGDENLHFCDVMIKDIADSKRINARIMDDFKKEGIIAENDEDSMQLNALILSYNFWPVFRDESLKLPDFLVEKLEKYTEYYKKLKGMRTLEWKSHLGLVQVELELLDRELRFSVSPIRAAIIYSFQQQSVWTVEALSTNLSSSPSSIRKHLGYWVGQGVLREDSNDTFSVIEKRSEKNRNSNIETDDYEESAMASADDQRESEYQVFWAYIVGMLTSLGKMKLERIHYMLKMFATQGPGQKECSESELKVFLDKKVQEQQLVIAGGEYQLPK